MCPDEPSHAMKVNVHLPSGDGYSVEVSPETAIQRRLRLIAKGCQLDLTATLCQLGLRDRDAVAAVAQLGQLAAAREAFSWHGHTSEVVTWGDLHGGGDCSQMQEQLRNVQHIQATGMAFDAVFVSGAVVTWGDPEYGGDSSQVGEQLRNVQHIQATGMAFAAILVSGAVVIWGNADLGGDSSQVQGTHSTSKQAWALLPPFLNLGLLGPGVIQNMVETSARWESSSGMSTTSKQLPTLLLPFLNPGLL